MRTLSAAGLALIAWTANATAKPDPHSANFMMAGCYASQNEQNLGILLERDAPTAALGFTCIGQVIGVFDTAADAGWICVSDSITIHQATSVILRYIEAHPVRRDEHFTSLALEALRAAWPCKQ